MKFIKFVLLATATVLTLSANAQEVKKQFSVLKVSLIHRISLNRMQRWFATKLSLLSEKQVVSLL